MGTPTSTPEASLPSSPQPGRTERSPERASTWAGTLFKGVVNLVTILLIIYLTYHFTVFFATPAPVATSSTEAEKALAKKAEDLRAQEQEGLVQLRLGQSRDQERADPRRASHGADRRRECTACCRRRLPPRPTWRQPQARVPWQKPVLPGGAGGSGALTAPRADELRRRGCRPPRRTAAPRRCRTAAPPEPHRLPWPRWLPRRLRPGSGWPPEPDLFHGLHGVPRSRRARYDRPQDDERRRADSGSHRPQVAGLPNRRRAGTFDPGRQREDHAGAGRTCWRWPTPT